MLHVIGLPRGIARRAASNRWNWAQSAQIRAVANGARRNFGPSYGTQSCSRHHASTLAYVYSFSAGKGPDRKVLPGNSARGNGTYFGAMEERFADDVFLQYCPLETR